MARDSLVLLFTQHNNEWLGAISSHCLAALLFSKKISMLGFSKQTYVSKTTSKQIFKSTANRAVAIARYHFSSVPVALLSNLTNNDDGRAAN